MNYDRVGWDAVDPEFLRRIAQGHDRATELENLLRELTGPDDARKRVKVWQELRDLDVLPPELTFYKIALELRQIGLDRYNARFEAEIQPRLEALYAEHGVDVSDLEALESWNPDPAPVELDQINRDIEAFEEMEIVGVYREFGETEMALLYADNYAEFQRRWKAGQDLVHGPNFFENLMQEISETYRDVADSP